MSAALAAAAAALTTGWPLGVVGLLVPRWGSRASARSALHALVRDEADVLRENEQLHREEVEASEKRFFHFGEVPPAPPRESIEWDAFEFGPTGSFRSGVLDSVPPARFGHADAARASRSPLFTMDDCRALIDEAEASASWRGASPIAAYCTNASTFQPVRELPLASAWLDQSLENIIYPAVVQAFPNTGLTLQELRCSAASIVKYNASAGQTRLGLHRDAPLLTGIIPLNGLHEYGGGGTFIETLQMSKSLGHSDGVLRREMGHLILHPASLRHGGASITRGLRYILVVWLFSAAYIPHAHYSTQRAARFLAAALRIPRSSGSVYRSEVLAAAADGFEEAIRLGSNKLTESAHSGLGQALLELVEMADAARIANGESETSEEQRQNRARALWALEEALRLAPSNDHVAVMLSSARATAKH